jgi:hypothetical protein
MAFMILATWLYINAWYILFSLFFEETFNSDDLRSGKGEECIPQTWDMYHEKYVFWFNLSNNV